MVTTVTAVTAVTPFLDLTTQALDIIEKSGGDFEILSFSVVPNDQRTEFKFKRPSSCTLRVYGNNLAALDDIMRRLQALVDVLEAAEGQLTVLPDKEEEAAAAAA